MAGSLLGCHRILPPTAEAAASCKAETGAAGAAATSGLDSSALDGSRATLVKHEPLAWPSTQLAWAGRNRLSKGGYDCPERLPP